jgi:hypothetical protein
MPSVSLATNCSAMSIPAETPAEQMNVPSSTHRVRTYVAPNCARTLWKAQCVVACRPSSRPTDARISAPVHTDPTTSAVSAAERT